MIKLSKASKMPCKSWSLQAIDTCPGSIDPIKQKLVEVCEGCYATTGNYSRSNVKKPREHNKEDWKRDDWEDDMVKAIEEDEYFRWLDSGDIYDLRLAIKIYNVCKRTKKTKHWIPTRMFKFEKFKGVLRELYNLPNVSLRISRDTVDPRNPDNSALNQSIVVTKETPNTTYCLSSARGGKCGDCRDCWDKSIKTIAYPAHGRKMLKLIATSSQGLV